MKFHLPQAILLLERGPLVVETLLHGLPEDWTMTNEGPDTWSPFDVIGHLVHGDRHDWMNRIEIILSSKSDKKFPPFDRFAQLKESKGKTTGQLLNEFKGIRAANIETLKKLKISDKQLKLTGLHPAFGEVTLKQLLATWVAHDMAHINQISRVMAKQYSEEIGPWINYMRVMKQ